MEGLEFVKNGDTGEIGLGYNELVLSFSFTSRYHPVLQRGRLFCTLILLFLSTVRLWRMLPKNIFIRAQKPIFSVPNKKFKLVLFLTEMVQNHWIKSKDLRCTTSYFGLKTNTKIGGFRLLCTGLVVHSIQYY